MERAIQFAVSNFPFTFLLLALAFAAVAIARQPPPRTAAFVVNRVFAYFLLFTIGACHLLNFVFHVFFGDIAAAYIGWAQSPFQAEVGFASLGFGVLGVLAVRGGFEMRLAAVLGQALFLLGAAGGHIVQMVTAQNFAPGNVGLIFYMDLALPLIGFTLLALQRRYGMPARPVTA